MAVVINELEVVVESAPSPEGHAAPAPQPAGAMDLIDLEERVRLYQLRLLAH